MGQAMVFFQERWDEIKSEELVLLGEKERTHWKNYPLTIDSQKWKAINFQRVIDIMKRIAPKPSETAGLKAIISKTIKDQDNEFNDAMKKYEIEINKATNEDVDFIDSETKKEKNEFLSKSLANSIGIGIILGLLGHPVLRNKSNENQDDSIKTELKHMGIGFGTGFIIGGIVSLISKLLPSQIGHRNISMSNRIKALYFIDIFEQKRLEDIQKFCEIRIATLESDIFKLKEQKDEKKKDELEGYENEKTELELFKSKLSTKRE